jgi:hypothetical protein
VRGGAEALLGPSEIGRRARPVGRLRGVDPGASAALGVVEERVRSYRDDSGDRGTDGNDPERLARRCADPFRRI